MKNEIVSGRIRCSIGIFVLVIRLVLLMKKFVYLNIVIRERLKLILVIRMNLLCICWSIW